MRRRSTRNKKNNHEKENTNYNKNNRKKKTKNNPYSNEEYEKQEDFRSEPLDKNRTSMFIMINKEEQNPIYSPRKPEKHYKDYIDNNMEIEENVELGNQFFIKEGRNVRKNRLKNKSYIDNVTIENDFFRSNIANKKKNDKKRQEEFNFKESNNNINEKVPQNKKKKDALLQKAKSRNERNPKNKTINNTESINIIIDKKEENKKKKTNRSCTTRNIKIKLEDENKTEKNKEKKKVQGNKNKGKKEKIKKEENDNIFENFYDIKNKSRSHLSNSIKEKKEKEKEKEKGRKNRETRNNRDYSSPRNIYGNNTNYILNNGIKEDFNKLKIHSTKKEIKTSKNIKDKLLEISRYEYSFASFDRRKLIITLNKKLKIKDNNIIINKDLIKEDKEEILLGRKRKRNEPKKAKKKKKENKNNKNSNKQNKAKGKNNPKAKSPKFPVVNDNDKIENKIKIEEMNKLKNDLNCDKNKDAGVKGKRRTKKYKSMIKKEKEYECEKYSNYGEIKLNSFDSISLPDKNFDELEHFNHKNKYNFKIPNQVNLSSDQMQIENLENNDSQKNNFLSNPLQNNANINNKINLNNENNINNKFYSNYDLANTNYININLSSNSLKDLNSETANFLEMSNYSFPIDLEEKIDIKEDKTYYAKASKYLKYHPLDKYISPICNEEKQPIKKRINYDKTNKISFLKKKENKNKINNQFDSDNDITDITSSNNEYNNYNNDLPSILNMPRIKPFREEHAKMIKDKLNLEGIKLYQNEDKNLQKEELECYIGSFVLYDEKNNIKVTVPCYKDNMNTKEFMKRKRLTIIEFQEDNDIDTDEEQLELEVQRNTNALLSFMNKVKKNKNYVDKNLMRKKKK